MTAANVYVMVDSGSTLLVLIGMASSAMGLTRLQPASTAFPRFHC